MVKAGLRPIEWAKSSKSRALVAWKVPDQPMGFLAHAAAGDDALDPSLHFLSCALGKGQEQDAAWIGHPHR